jgi:hypothetical protein
MVDPIVSYLGVESGDPVGHKRFLALFSGGMLPIISLSFLHMLVKFEEEDKVYGNPIPIVDIDELSTIAGKLEGEVLNERYVPTEDQMNKLEDELRKLNEQKFGNLVEQPQEEQSEIKRLSYTKR